MNLYNTHLKRFTISIPRYSHVGEHRVDQNIEKLGLKTPKKSP